MNYVLQYINKIESGEIITSQKVKKFYLTAIKPIVDSKDPKHFQLPYSRYGFNERLGEAPIKWIEKNCKQSKGEWRGKNLDLLLFQKAKWQAIFGIVDRNTGLRRFKEIFDVRARKNCKTTEHAAIALYLLRQEMGAEVYCCAATRDQAKRLWDEARSMVNFNSDLTANKSPSKGNIGNGKFRIKQAPIPDIYISEQDSHLKALSSNVDALDGLNSSAAIIDEVHALDRDIYDLIKQSMSVRQQPLLSAITTAGFVRGGLFDDLYNHACNVIDGVIGDDTFFPLIYELDNSSEMEDESCWVKANPAIDVVKSRTALREVVERSHSDLNFAPSVKTKDFNMRGIDGKTWLDFETLNNELVYSDDEMKNFDNTIVLGGFDLSRCMDLTAFSTLLFDKVQHKIIAVTKYWMTQRFLESEQAKKSKVPWKSWIDRGLIDISGTDMISYKDVADYVISNYKEKGWNYRFINYDPYSANYLIEELSAYGYAKDSCLIATPQGAKTLSIPMQTLEAHLRNKTLSYQDNPITKWCLTNVELEQDRNGNYMPKKANDDRSRKIDGVATILNCYVSLCQNIDYYLYC